MPTETGDRVPEHSSARGEVAVAARETPVREYGLDWLRAAAFAILIFYHSGMIFVPWDFHIKNGERSDTLALIMLFFNRWRLPLLFLIAGCGVAFSLRRRSWGEFSWERTQRLLLPLLFGMFVIVPPQIYFERLQQGAHFTYAEFHRSVFAFVPYPRGSFSWHHLWFVAYLYVYCLAGIPVFALLRSQAGGRMLTAMVTLFRSHPIWLYLVNVPSLAIGLWLGPRWPTTHNLTSDWANLTGSFITFLWGFVIAFAPGFLDLIEQRRREFTAGAIGMTIVMYWLRIAAPRAEPWWSLVSSYMGMLWLFTLIGWARASIRTGGPRLRYATEAVYPFYILHQTIIVVAGYYIVGLPWPILPKLLLVMTIGFFGSWLGFEIIRRWNVTRVLFGLKPKISGGS
jgi:hypothetical protein